MKLKNTLLAATLLSSSLALAEDIAIAPAPVADDSIIGAGSEGRFTVGFMSYSGDSYELSGATLAVGMKDRNGEGMVTDGSLSLTGLSGDASGTDITGAMLGGNFLLGAELGAPEGVIYVGPTVTLTALSMDTIYVINNTIFQDTMTITTLLYGATGGLQYKVNLPFGSITPWFFASYIGGTSNTETTFTSSSADIEFMTTTQFGFDMYFKDIGTSLSSMYQTTEGGNLLSLSATFHF